METTGLDFERHGIVQIAGIVDVDSVVVETFNFFVKPYPLDEISLEAVAVNGYDANREALTPTEAYKAVVDVFSKYVDRYNKEDKFVLIGQNVEFDYRFLDKFFKKNRNDYLYAFLHYRKIDLITISSFLMEAGKIKGGKTNLKAVAELVGVSFDAHKALSDVIALREIFYKFLGLISK